MNPVIFLSSLNKIGLFAFLITLGFLIYEVILLTRTKKAKGVPQVPKFQEGGQQIIQPTTEIVNPTGKNISRNNKIILAVLTILLMLFGGLTVISSLNSGSNTGSTDITPTQAFAVDPAGKAVIPTGIVRVNQDPVPSDSQLSHQQVDNPGPTEVLLAQSNPTSEPVESDEPVNQTETPIPTEEPNVYTTEAEPSPTVITQLPVTSYINNLLIMFTVSAVFLFFAFLF